MKNNYSIIIDSTDGLISIPFKNLEQIDNFTAHFENSKTIAITLIDVFNLNIKKENVRHISVNKNFQIKGKEINKNLPIILSNDIYDEEKIKIPIACPAPCGYTCSVKKGRGGGRLGL